MTKQNCVMSGIFQFFSIIERVAKKWLDHRELHLLSLQEIYLVMFFVKIKILQVVYRVNVPVDLRDYYYTTFIELSEKPYCSCVRNRPSNS